MHTDPEMLSLFALGEEVGSEDDHVHIRTCAECGSELSMLQRLVTLGRSVSTDTRLDTPSTDVWGRIREELNLRPAQEPHMHRPAFLPLNTPNPPTVARPLDASSAKRANKHTRRSPLPVIQAADAGSTFRIGNELTARAELTPVEAFWSHASGEAELATDEHGRRLLQVALHADLPTSGLRQAWLVHRENPNLRQSLGILDGPHGLWTVEHSINLQQYGILDISQQAIGQTHHSGQTIVRGELTSVG